MSVEDQLRHVFETAGAQGFVHVREVGHPLAVSVEADTPVAAASVIKIVIALAFARKVAAGEIDPTEPVTVPARYRIGGTGTAGCQDPAILSIRDLARFMMTMSDNAATDVVYGRVGQAAIDAVCVDLGLRHSHVRCDMESGHASVVTELGLDNAEGLDAKVLDAGDAAWALSWIDPARANASTARDTATLLEAIWTDRAGDPGACAFVRSVMSAQVTSHRLAAAFGDDVHVAGKTGTLPTVRNEAGVITYPDGRHYVAAVFTRAHSLAGRQPAIDTAVGRAAHLAIEALRQRPS